MTTPTDYYSFAFNGFLFGAGTPFPILSVDGLEGLPDLRTQDDNRGYNDGMFSGRDFLAGRTITIEMLTLAGNGNSAQTNFNLLQAAMLPQQQGTGLLQFQLSASDGLRRANARVRKRVTKIDPEYTYGFIKSVWQFFAPDPRYYDDSQQSGSMAPTTPSGRTYNRTYNLTFGGGTQASAVNVQNNGYVTTYPTVTVNGPVVSPIIGNQTTGQVMQFNVTLSSTDVLVIDLAERLITLNGNPARNLLTGTSQWLSAPVGSSVFYFNGTGTTVGVTAAVVTWRNAYV